MKQLQNLKKGFQVKHPQIQIEERTFKIAELRRQIKLAFLGEEPPDMFNQPTGYTMREYADAGYLLPITDVWKEAKCDEVFPRGIVLLNS